MARLSRTQLLSLRDGVAELTKEAATDLNVVWRAVEKATDAGEALDDILPALVDSYGQAAAAMAADWYDDLREKAEVGRGFRADPINIADSGTHALVGWALAGATDYQTFQTLILGGTQRRIANFARGTVTTSSIADPGARGWQRMGGGECDFCAMLIGRGAVYSEATADFSAHDHDECIAVPAFDGQPKPVQPYTPSVRHSEADQARAREWITDHL